jgi:hypothetical protein
MQLIVTFASHFQSKVFRLIGSKETGVMTDPTYYCETNDTAVVVSPATSSPGSGWSLETLQQAINIAQTAEKPLNILPGTYLASQLTITASIEIYAAPGMVMIMPSGSTCVNRSNVEVHACRQVPQASTSKLLRLTT